MDGLAAGDGLVASGSVTKSAAGKAPFPTAAGMVPFPTKKGICTAHTLDSPWLPWLLSLPIFFSSPFSLPLFSLLQCYVVALLLSRFLLPQLRQRENGSACNDNVLMSILISFFPFFPKSDRNCSQSAVTKTARPTLEHADSASNTAPSKCPVLSSVRTKGEKVTR